MIYYLKNLKINIKNIKILNKEGIKKLNLLFINNKNSNALSLYTISELLDVNEDNKYNNKFYSSNLVKNFDDKEYNEDDEFKEEDEFNNLFNNIESLNLEDNKDLRYNIIQNLKEINLDKNYKDITNEINNI